MKRRRKRRARVRLSPEEKKQKQEQNRFRSLIRSVFASSGFLQVSTRDKHLSVAGRTMEFDACFVSENTMVVVEDTISRDVNDHLRKKAEQYHHALANETALLEAIREASPDFLAHLQKSEKYELSDFRVRFIYCTPESVERDYKNRYASACHFLNKSELLYFQSLAKTIKYSALFEILKFLNIDLAKYGSQSSATSSESYEGLLLPEGPSGFPPGHKIVSMLVAPRMLLEQAYVLRADGWQDSDCLYQRLLIRSKIRSMRQYLTNEKRVFVNNIIATLPSESVLYDKETKKELHAPDANGLRTVKIQIPKEFNNVGIIDGQHRVYSYHKGEDEFEKKIGVLRDKQHLLLTGIIFPSDFSPEKRQAFEAKLFLEINDKQKRVKSDLKQTIEAIVTPNSVISIAKAVIYRLSEQGALKGLLQTHFFDQKKIKTASIVSYGLRHVVKPEMADDSFYSIWQDADKDNWEKNKAVRQRYEEFCAGKLSTLFGAYKEAVKAKGLWSADPKISRALTTTALNGVIFLARRLIENKKMRKDFHFYQDGLSKLSINFTPKGFKYKSSHWKELGDEMYKQCFP